MNSHIHLFWKGFFGGMIVLSEAEVKLYCIRLNLDGEMYEFV